MKGSSRERQKDKSPTLNHKSLIPPFLLHQSVAHGARKKKPKKCAAFAREGKLHHRNRTTTLSLALPRDDHSVSSAGQCRPGRRSGRQAGSGGYGGARWCECLVVSCSPNHGVPVSQRSIWLGEVRNRACTCEVQKKGRRRNTETEETNVMVL